MKRVRMCLVCLVSIVSMLFGSLSYVYACSYNCEDKKCTYEEDCEDCPNNYYYDKGKSQGGNLDKQREKETGYLDLYEEEEETQGLPWEDNSDSFYKYRKDNNRKGFTWFDEKPKFYSEEEESCLGIVVHDEKIEGIVDIISGAYVDEIIPNTPVSTCGLDVGDLITAVNGDEITTAQELSTYLIENVEPYEKVTITVTLTNARGYYKTIDYTTRTVDRSIFRNYEYQNEYTYTDEYANSYEDTYEEDTYEEDTYDNDFALDFYNYMALLDKPAGYFYYNNEYYPEDAILYHDKDEVWYILVDVGTNTWEVLDRFEEVINADCLYLLGYNHANALKARDVDKYQGFDIPYFPNIKESENYRR